MIRTRFGNVIALACLGAVAACTSGGGTDTAAGNTDIELTIGQEGSAQAFDVDRVDYTVFCDGADTTGADTPDGTPINDDATFSGQFEIVDTRNPPVWQALMDLPPGDCTITLSVSDEDEVVCTGTQTLQVVADADPATINKFNIEMVCDLSFQSPVANADVDGTFRFVVGNFCPSLYTFNAIPSVHAIDGDGISELQVRAQDFDGTCGTSCDPDGPSPGLSTTVTCSGGIQSPLGGDGSDTDNYTLDCNGQVGDITCRVDATDGDNDCDKSKTLTVTCPGANPCVGNPCDDGNDCTANACTPIDETLFDCTDTFVDAGTFCEAVGGGLCDGAGTCVAQGCLNDNPDCNLDGNECTEADAGSCVAGTCTLPEVPVTDGTSCSGGLGSCQGGTCIDNCTGVDCSDPGPNAECTQDLCDPSTNPGTCSNPPVADCTNCCDSGGGAGSGDCTSGVCAEPAIFATCDPTGQGAVVPCQKVEFLAVDCELLGNSAALPIQAEVTPTGVAFAGQPVGVIISDGIILPAALVCGFIDPGGFTSASVANSFVGNSISNADLTSVTLNSFLDDGTAGGALVSPHEDVFFDFAAACGTPEGSGPGILAPTVNRATDPQTIPPDPIPMVITPTAPGTVDFQVQYSGLALELRDLAGPAGIPEACVGGLCPSIPFPSGDPGTDICTPIDRDGDDAVGGAGDSPRIMYDAICNKLEFQAGDCNPFEDFPTTADACKGDPRLPPPPCCNVPGDTFCQDPAAWANCCDVLQQNWPTAGVAQQPQLPVNP